MIQIVHAQAYDVLAWTGNGGQKRYFRQRDRRAAALCRFSGGAQIGQRGSFNESVHVGIGQRQHGGAVFREGTYKSCSSVGVCDEFHEMSLLRICNGVQASADSMALSAISEGRVMPMASRASEFT